MLSFPLYLVNLYGWFGSLPSTRAYVARIEQRPAFQAAIADARVAMARMRSTPPEYPSFRSTEAAS